MSSIFDEKPKRSRTTRRKEADTLGMVEILDKSRRSGRVKAEQAKLELMKKIAEEKLIKEFEKKQRKEKQEFKKKMAAEIDDLADQLLQSNMTTDVEDLMSMMNVNEQGKKIYKNPFTDFRIKKRSRSKSTSKKTKTKTKRVSKKYRKSRVKRSKYRLSRKKKYSSKRTKAKRSRK